MRKFLTITAAVLTIGFAVFYFFVFITDPPKCWSGDSTEPAVRMLHCF